MMHDFKARLRQAVLSGLALLVFAPVCHAGTYYVSPTGNDKSSGTPSQPFLSLKHAVAAIPNDSTLALMAGTYSGPQNEDVDLNGKNIVLIGRNATISPAAGHLAFIVAHNEIHVQFIGIHFQKAPADHSLFISHGSIVRFTGCTFPMPATKGSDIVNGGNIRVTDATQYQLHGKDVDSPNISHIGWYATAMLELKHQLSADGTDHALH